MAFCSVGLPGHDAIALLSLAAPRPRHFDSPLVPLKSTSPLLEELALYSQVVVSHRYCLSPDIRRQHVLTHEVQRFNYEKMSSLVIVLR